MDQQKIASKPEKVYNSAMERLFNFISDKWDARQTRLEMLYEELGQASPTPSFRDLVLRRERLERRAEWLEERFETAVDKLETKGGPVRSLLLMALSVGADFVEGVYFPKAEKHLGAVYGRRIKRLERQLEKKLRR